MAAVKTFEAVATREGKWWVVDVDGVGATQGRTTSEAQEMAEDLVTAMLGVTAKDFVVDIVYRLPDDLAVEFEEARRQQRLAEEAQQRAAAASRKLVHNVLAAGLSKRDAARVLGLSPQRISQLTADPG
jgi:DNA-binding PucR family transcriptional regulator